MKWKPPIGPFVVGSKGRRSGLAVTEFGGVEVRVLVVPKVWGSSKSGPGKVSARFDSSRLTIIVAENNAFWIQCADNVGVSDFTALYTCFRQLTITAESVATQKPQGSGDAGTDDSEDEDTRRAPLIAKGKSGKKVFSISLSSKGDAPDGPALVGVDDDTRGSDCDAFTYYWGGLLSLWLKALGLKGLSEVDLDQLDWLSASEVLSTDLRLLLYVSFVRQVANLLHHARPGYSRVTKPSRFIRGRMNPVSAATVLAGGPLTVECTYDEFGLDTPLLRVIATALEEVADTDPAELLVPDATDVTDEAAWLRQKFEAVRSLSPVAALRVGVDLQRKTSKLDGDWGSALVQACLILESGSLSPAPGGAQAPLAWSSRSEHGYVFDVSTDSCWEHLVRLYFGGDKRAKKPGSKKSWEDLGGGKAPDGYVQDCKLIFDAKYKERKTTPSPSDQHQIFVHSHLFDAQHALLIYPGKDPCCLKEALKKDAKLHRRLSSYKAPHFDLRVVNFAFPRPKDLRNANAWDEFLRRRSRWMNLLLHKLKAPASKGA